MPAALRGVLRSEDGVALVLALVTIVVMLLITTALVVAAATETLSAQVHEDSGRALNVAEAGAAHAIGYALRFDRDWSDNLGADATAGTCGSITIGGTTWFVLGDATRGGCLLDVPYPNTAAVAVQVPPPATGGGGVDVACGTALVNVGTGVGGGTPPPVQQIGTYTVVFHPTQARTDGTLTLRVTGNVGRATRGVEFVARRVTPAAFVAYSASTVQAVAAGAGTFEISGSIYIRGDWSYKGNSRQFNSRPVTSADAKSEPFENRTFVCNNLAMQGNAQIGEPTRPMRGVHVGGSIIQGGSADIHTNRMNKAVPDIGLGDVERLTRCIRGALPQAECDAEFGPGMWDSYTNHLVGGQTRWVVHRVQGNQPAEWVLENAPSHLVFDRTTRFALPRRGQEALCRARLIAGQPLEAVLAVCALYYRPPDDDRPEGHIHVAGNQVIYVHGRITTEAPIRYRVDDRPGLEAQTQRDTSIIVVGCEGCGGGQDSVHLNRQRFLAWNRGSQDPFFAHSDLLAFLVNGQARIRGQGQSGPCTTPSEQEVNAAFVVGGNPGRLISHYRPQVHGSLIAHTLVLDEPPRAMNFWWCQVPDIGELLGPTLVAQFLNNPRYSTVIMQNWREVGF
jgi:hypothetical protein